MKEALKRLQRIFTELNKAIAQINSSRSKDGLLPVSKAEVKLLDQMSLLADEKASLVLSLAQTGDLDALLVMDHAIKDELKRILEKEGLIYDEDSPLVWIPKGALFNELFDFKQVVVKSIDPESALVSKAVKDPLKNKQLIRQALASEEFPGLVDRILKHGGKLENFL